MNQLGRRLYGWACERLYDELAPAYESVAALVSLGRWDRWRQSVLPFVAGEQVVEMGCGTGRLLPHLARAHRHVIGVDRSPAMIAQCAQYLPHTQCCNVVLIHASSQAIPIASNVVDTVVSTFPAPYILERPTLDEIRRVLRPRVGKLIIAGLWVRVLDANEGGRSAGLTVLRKIPYFYSTPGDPSVQSHLAHKVMARFSEHGFIVQMTEAVVDGTAVGIVVATPNDTFACEGHHQR